MPFGKDQNRVRKAAFIIPAIALAGLALGLAVAGVTPTQMRDMANEPWRDQGKALSEAKADADESARASQLAPEYGFAERELESREDREAYADEVMMEEMSPEPEANADLAPVPQVKYKPLGINQIERTERAALPARKPPEAAPVGTREAQAPVRAVDDDGASSVGSGIY